MIIVVGHITVEPQHCESQPTTAMAGAMRNEPLLLKNRAAYIDRSVTGYNNPRRSAISQF
jgi:hypothetical protein